MRSKLLAIGLLANSFLFAQFKVSFTVDHLPEGHKPTDSLYIAGSFNGWNPGDEKAQLHFDGHKYGITIDLPRGKTEYKMTRGSWEKVEATEKGENIANRKADVESDTTIHVEIHQWADHFRHEEKKSTASRNVHILDSNFYMPQLDRHRRVWIYLPKSYKTSKKKYPVLYMQDGQNIFDAATSFSGEWGVDEALDSIDTKECIVVGIDNGREKRLNEYCPYDMAEHGKGEGDLYLAFIVKTLKPYIDQHFRTKRSRENTFIAGSSMGGLISFYAMLKYPAVFGGAGVFSPAFWIAPDLMKDVAKRAAKVKGRIYFYAGKQESETMVPGMLAIFQKMHQLSKAQMEIVIRDEGTHSEAHWREEFPKFYGWLNPRSATAERASVQGYTKLH